MERSRSATPSELSGDNDSQEKVLSLQVDVMSNTVTYRHTKALGYTGYQRGLKCMYAHCLKKYYN